jgi:hypothetical protein
MDDVVYMVRTKTQETCQRELDRLCALLGAVTRTQPTDALPPGWVARAALPCDEEPADR